jgi:chromosome segregation ATPase
MIAEGSSSSQTPMPRGGPSPSSQPPPSERDLLAERRARRAVESGESALLRRAEVAEATVKTLEAHVSSLQRRLEEAEREGSQRTSVFAQRLEDVESALQTIRESHRRMAVSVSELKGVAAQLRVAVEREPVAESETVRPRSEEMADALAAAVERLRARAQESAAAEQPQGATAQPAPSIETQSWSGVAAQAMPRATLAVGTPHKHTMSLIGRWRMRRKQRRGR